MSTTPLEQKTIRPGSLLGYSYYYSNAKRPAAKPTAKGKGAKNKKAPASKPQRSYKGKLLAVLVLAIVAVGVIHANGHQKVVNVSQSKSTTTHTTTPAPVSTPAPKPAAPVVATPAATNYCAGNTLNELVLVSISQRHMWACQQSTTVYDSAVVTGISYLAADLTPTGTYHIYAKETDRHLIGSDSTGSWNDFVYYWMPFLHNQYGNYGFHDATWRAPDAFGNISPDSASASHGCVEMPLATAKWLYNWSYVGTTVTIQS